MRFIIMKKYLLLMPLVTLKATTSLYCMNPDGTPPREKFTIHSRDLNSPSIQRIRKEGTRKSQEQKRLRGQKLNTIKINFIVTNEEVSSLWETSIEASSTSAIRTIILGVTGPIGTIGEAILNEIIALARERYQEGSLNRNRFLQALQTITLTISTNIGLGPLAEIPGFGGMVRNILTQRLQATYNSLNNRFNPQTPQKSIYYWNVDGQSINVHVDIDPIHNLTHQAPREVTGDLIDNSTGQVVENTMGYLFGS